MLNDLWFYLRGNTNQLPSKLDTRKDEKKDTFALLTQMVNAVPISREYSWPFVKEDSAYDLLPWLSRNVESIVTYQQKQKNLEHANSIIQTASWIDGYQDPRYEHYLDRIHCTVLQGALSPIQQQRRHLTRNSIFWKQPEQYHRKRGTPPFRSDAFLQRSCCLSDDSTLLESRFMDEIKKSKAS